MSEGMLPQLVTCHSSLGIAFEGGQCGQKSAIMADFQRD
jgi:hypothetical protein